MSRNYNLFMYSFLLRLKGGDGSAISIIKKTHFSFANDEESVTSRSLPDDVIPFVVGSLHPREKWN